MSKFAYLAEMRESAQKAKPEAIHVKPAKKQ